MSNANKYLRFLTRLEQKSKSPLNPNRVVDGSDVLYQQGHRIVFTRVGVLPQYGKARFKAFITAFNETWNSNWNSETVYGRIDPIVMFKNTERRISLGFKVPAADTYEAQQNMAELQTLIQSLYPSYSSFNEGATIYDGTITQSPLLRVQIGDLLGMHTNLVAERGADVLTPEARGTHGAGDFEEASRRILPNARGPTLSAQEDQGLLCYVTNFTINYNLEGDTGVFEGTQRSTGYGILPRLIEVNMDLGVLHEKRMGWWPNAEVNGAHTFGGVTDGHGAEAYPWGYSSDLKRGSPHRLNAPTRDTNAGTSTTLENPNAELPTGGTGDATPGENAEDDPLGS